jgi:uncharacterized Zn-binding protein involved in type VI secretion
MGKPAARMGDPTAHGGVIMTGLPTVLIGGMPAARLTDMHTCPMVTPAVPPVPHVGGPISGPGIPTVLIGGMPAACLGDMAVCVGPPSTIIMGCPTVLIGPGGGGGGGGGAGSSGAGSAQTSAKQALTDNVESETKEEHWIEFEFKDKAGNLLSGIPYKLKDTESKESKNALQSHGKIRRDSLKEGEAEVKLFNVSNAKWSKDKAEVGERVKLTADVEGFEDGTQATIEIYKRDLNAADVVIETIKAEVNSNKVEVEWEYINVEEDLNTEQSNDDSTLKYTVPEYYFIVIVDHIKARSNTVEYKDYIEIELKDSDGQVVPNEEYVLYLANGEVRTGKLDANGKKKEKNVPPFAWDISFPNLRGAYEK